LLNSSQLRSLDELWPKGFVQKCCLNLRKVGRWGVAPPWFPRFPLAMASAFRYVQEPVLIQRLSLESSPSGV